MAPSFCLLLIQFMDEFLCVFPQDFWPFLTFSPSKLFAKIVQINSLGGATIPYAAYTAF